MARLAQQQQSSAAHADSWTPLIHLLSLVQPLLGCWHTKVQQVPTLLPVVVRTLRPLVQQLQGCGTMLMQPAAAAAAARSAPTASVQAGSSSSSSSGVHKLQCALVGTQQAASMLLNTIDQQQQLEAGVAAEVLELQNDPAVVAMQLQLLTAWAAQLHKQHTAQQQQSPAGSSSSSITQQQEQQQPAKQQHRADLLSIPAFHQDMLQLLPGGQAYLDAAAEAAAGRGLIAGANTVQQCIHHAGGCCHAINQYLYRHLQSIEGRQQLRSNGLVVSGAAVRLVLELQLLASGAVQRQREQHRQQQQQHGSTAEDHGITDKFALLTWDLLRMQIMALVASSRSCLPPEVLQQAGLQLLQALAAPLQQWQLSRSGDSFLQNAALIGVLPQFGNTLQALVTAACGAEPTDGHGRFGEHDQQFRRVISKGILAAAATTAVHLTSGLPPPPPHHHHRHTAPAVREG
jgi:hypothetical protein